jgi:hypothetical protein
MQLSTEPALLFIVGGDFVFDSKERKEDDRSEVLASLVLRIMCCWKVNVVVVVVIICSCSLLPVACCLLPVAYCLLPVAVCVVDDDSLVMKFPSDISQSINALSLLVDY